MRHGLTDEQWNAIENILPETAATGWPQPFFVKPTVCEAAI